MGIWWLIGILIYSIVCSYMCVSLARTKKYSRLFNFVLVGFIFGVLGVIYVAGLPINISIKEEILNCITNILSEEDMPNEDSLKILLTEKVDS